MMKHLTTNLYSAISKVGGATLLLAITASTAHAGLFDDINKVINTVDRANNTMDRAERSAKRTTDRFGGHKNQSQNQGQTGTQGYSNYPNQNMPNQSMPNNMPTMGGFNNNMAYPANISYVAGIWKFDWGNLSLQQNGNQVSGTYTEDAGQVGGTMMGNVFNGYWSEATSDKPCTTPLNGRYHWGRMQLQFTNEGFVGKWGYCNEAVYRKLKGTPLQLQAQPATVPTNTVPTTGYPVNSNVVVVPTGGQVVPFHPKGSSTTKSQGYNTGVGSITLNKYNFHPGETIVVSYNAPRSITKTAWIGIIPANIKHGSERVNDNNDIDYRYLEQGVVGTFSFKAPSKPGLYDFRMNDNDNNGKEITYISFNVR